MKSRASFSVASLVVLLAAAGCAGSKDASDKQLEEMRATLTKMKADQGALTERLEALELARVRAAQGGDAATSGGAGPDLAVVHLAPAGAEPTEDTDDPSARAVIRAVGGAVTLDDKARSQGPDRDYQVAMDLFKEKKNEKALAAFAAFLSRYPDHPRAESVTFARGELFAGKGDHRRAIEQYESIADRWPTSAQAPDALLRAAQSYTRLGDKNDSDEVKKRIASTYPSSEAAKKLAASPGVKP